MDREFRRDQDRPEQAGRRQRHESARLPKSADAIRRYLLLAITAAVILAIGVVAGIQTRSKDLPSSESNASSTASLAGPDLSSGDSLQRSAQVSERARPLPGWLARQKSDALLTEPLPANSYTLDAVSGIVRAADGEHELKGDQGLFDRILIREGERIAISLRLPALQPGRELVVTASNGGRIERRGGPLAFVPRESSATLDLSFTPTLGRGAYSIDIRHAGSVATLAFWAGPRFPSGEPGPDFTPLPQPSEVIP